MKCKDCAYYAKECIVTADLPACADFKLRPVKVRGTCVSSSEYYAARAAGRRTDVVAGNYIIYK